MMNKRRREQVASLTLLGASLLIGLALTEWYLRLTSSLEDLYMPVQYHPRIASAGWERMFLRDYAALRTQQTFGADLNGYVHDPELGWDTPGRLRDPAPRTTARSPGRFRVLAIGDSYTYGSEVQANETYPYYLEQELAGGEVLNMGVRAYGIDQAALKYLKYGRAYRPEVLVFGVFAPDYVRDPLTFYRFAKPRLALGPAGELTTTNVPIPPPEEVYRRLRQTSWPLSYAFALLRSGFHTMADARPNEPYFRRWDPLHEAIFAAVLDAADRDGSQVVFLHIPTGAQFANDAALNDRCCERGHLLAIWQRLAARHPSLHVIDLLDELPKTYSRKIVYEQMIIHHQGQPIGHFTPFGNRAVARIIAHHLHRDVGVALSASAACRSATACP